MLEKLRVAILPPASRRSTQRLAWFFSGEYVQAMAKPMEVALSVVASIAAIGVLWFSGNAAAWWIQWAMGVVIGLVGGYWLFGRKKPN